MASCCNVSLFLFGRDYCFKLSNVGISLMLHTDAFKLAVINTIKINKIAILNRK